MCISSSSCANTGAAQSSPRQSRKQHTYFTERIVHPTRLSPTLYRNPAVFTSPGSRSVMVPACVSGEYLGGAGLGRAGWVEQTGKSRLGRAGWVEQAG